MIYCVTQDPSLYVETLPDGQKLGLYTEYGYKPMLFNLISRTVTAMFMYEDGFETWPLGKRIKRLHGGQFLVDSLDQEVGGIKLTTLLEKTNPETMFELFEEQKPNHLELLKVYGGNWDSLMMSMAARVLQFRKHYRGIINTNKNLITGQFKSDLSQEETQHLSLYITNLRGAFKASMK